MTVEDLYVWCAPDMTGEDGILTAYVPAFGSVVPLVFARRQTAELMREVVRDRADDLGVRVRLLRMTVDGVVDTVDPRTS